MGFQVHVCAKGSVCYGVCYHLYLCDSYDDEDNDYCYWCTSYCCSSYSSSCSSSYWYSSCSCCAGDLCMLVMFRFFLCKPFPILLVPCGATVCCVILIYHNWFSWNASWHIMSFQVVGGLSVRLHYLWRNFHLTVLSLSLSTSMFLCLTVSLPLSVCLSVCLSIYAGKLFPNRAAPLREDVVLFVSEHCVGMLGVVLLSCSF